MDGSRIGTEKVKVVSVFRSTKSQNDVKRVVEKTVVIKCRLCW